MNKNLKTTGAKNNVVLEKNAESAMDQKNN
jgi:hypothetical protein